MECQEIEQCRNSINTRNVFIGLISYAWVHTGQTGVKTDFGTTGTFGFLINFISPKGL